MLVLSVEQVPVVQALTAASSVPLTLEATMIFFVAPSFLLINDESDNWRTGADPPRCTSFLSARGTARSLRHFDQRAKYLGKTTEGWRQPSQDGCAGLAREIRVRKMDGLRKCIAVDNHEAVKVGDVEKNMESKEVVKPKFTTDFPETVVRSG